jgi:anti-sigma factor RsiW
MTIERDPSEWPRLRRAPSDADEHVRDLLPSYVNGTLEPVEFGRVSEHLARCAGCRAALRSWEAIGTAVRSSAVASAGVRDRLLDRVMGEIEPTASAEMASVPTSRPSPSSLPPLPATDDDPEGAFAAPQSIAAIPFGLEPLAADWHPEPPEKGWPLIAEVVAAAIVLLIVVGVFLVYR